MTLEEAMALFNENNNYPITVAMPNGNIYRLDHDTVFYAGMVERHRVGIYGSVDPTVYGFRVSNIPRFNGKVKWFRLSTVSPVK